MADHDSTDLLRRGAAYGVGAYAAGLAIMYALVTRSTRDLPLDAIAILYGATHGIVRPDDGSSEVLLTADPRVGLVMLAVPGVPLTVAGYLAARRADLPPGAPSGTGARHGAGIAGAYTVLLVASAVALEYDPPGGGVFVETGTVGLDPVTALLGGTLIGAVFGALGGAIAARRT